MRARFSRSARGVAFAVVLGLLAACSKEGSGPPGGTPAPNTSTGGVWGSSNWNQSTWQ
jgi:hypothetical protein